jgi:hypothetical protein
MISFKGAHFPKDVIKYAVFFNVRYDFSYHDLGSVDVSKRINQRVIFIQLMNSAIKIMRRHSWLVNNGYPCLNCVEKIVF